MKNGIPVNTRYGGILEVKGKKPAGFDDLIVYTGTTIDPMRIFISRKMTRVLDAVKTGSGMLLANLREIPESAVAEANDVLDAITDMGIGGIAEIGEPGKAVLNAPVEAGMVGIAAYAGVNGMAAVEEMGIRVDTHPISTIVDFRELKKIG